MKNGFLKISVLLLAVILVIAAVTGCKKSTDASGKSAQVLEQENAQLAKQVADLKAQLSKASEGSKTADTQAQGLGDEMMKLMEENVKLMQDVNDLKKQIEVLKAGTPK